MRHLSPIQIKIHPHGKGLDLPSYATSGSAGMDLMAAIEEDMILKPGQRALVPSGISMALPQGWEGQIRPRSGLAYKEGLTVLNAPGTIDSDYRGEVKVLLIHLGQEDFVLKRGLRMAQLVISPVTQISWQEIGEEDFSVTPSEGRGSGGFGSTGLYAHK